MDAVRKSREIPLSTSGRPE